MCECGCMGSGKFWKLPAPDGGLYLLNKNTGCPDCPGPIGVGVQFVDRNDSNFDDYNMYEELPLTKDNYYLNYIWFFTEEDLRLKFVDFCKETNAFPMKDDIDLDITFEEFLKEFYYDSRQWKTNISMQGS